MTLREHSIVFWQGMISPHMAPLASALAERGHQVTYIACEAMSRDRKALGWEVPDTKNMRTLVLDTDQSRLSFIEGCPSSVIHLVEGVRGGSARLRHTRMVLRKRCLFWGTVLEVADERNILFRWLKRAVYRRLLSAPGTRPQFVLAIGGGMASWCADRGFTAERIFPFAYFLEPSRLEAERPVLRTGVQQIGYVGQHVPRKGIDLLIDALSACQDRDWNLLCVGGGAAEKVLRNKAARTLSEGRVTWLGMLPRSRIPALMASLDCLVLPSDYDGWGAVVSEAMMVGTPVICSDKCGAAVAVRASGFGQVFRAGDFQDLGRALAWALEKGRLSKAERQEISEWALCLNNQSGASYLEAILNHLVSGIQRPRVPWVI